MAGVPAEGEDVRMAGAGACASGCVCCMRTVAFGIVGFAAGATWMRVVSFFGEPGFMVAPRPGAAVGAAGVPGAPGAGFNGIVIVLGGSVGGFCGSVGGFGGNVGGFGTPGAETGLKPTGAEGMLGGGGTDDGGGGIVGVSGTDGASAIFVVSFFGPGTLMRAVSPAFGGSVIFTVSFFGEPGAGVSSGIKKSVRWFCISSRGKRVNPIRRDARRVRARLFFLAVFQAIGYVPRMKILVTGGAGFIGSHLVERLLREGHDVAVVDEFNDFYDPAIKRANLALVKKDIALHEADIRDESAVHRIVRDGKFDAIMHLAARAGVRPSIRSPKLYIDTNITGTFHLLEAARAAGVPCFVFASSSSVYGVLKTVPFREDMAINETISPYAATKMAGEQLCSNYSHLYGTRTVALRFFTVYGPRQRPDLAIHKFTRAIFENKPIDQYGDGSTRRDYTFIDDIQQGLLACLRYDGPLFDIFNLGESQTTTLTELIESIERALGKKANINRLSEQPGDVPLTFADISKSKKLLGYHPTTKIAEGIPKFVDWFLKIRK